MTFTAFPSENKNLILNGKFHPLAILMTLSDLKRLNAKILKSHSVSVRCVTVDTFALIDWVASPMAALNPGLEVEGKEHPAHDAR